MANTTDEVPRGPIITIDGPAGAGKSTVARLLAEKLGFLLLDTGALYRALALHLTRLRFTPEDSPIPADALRNQNMRLRVKPDVAAMRVFLGEEEVTQTIRSDWVAVAASGFSAKPEVRKALLQIQRSTAERGNVVAEGRDMGTVVFPAAPVKFFLTASLEERSRRRHKELVERGDQLDPSAVKADMRTRDERDRTRVQSPLVKAADAIEVDCTALDPDRVIDLMMKHISRQLNGAVRLREAPPLVNKA